MKKEISFPLYRKTKNGTNFYKIISEKEMLEIQIIGSKYTVHKLEAKIFPDFTLINDLIENNHDAWVPSNISEYVNHLERCITNFKKID